MRDFDTSHLSGNALKAAKAIMSVVSKHMPDASGGGCQAFRKPEEWKNSKYGQNSVLVTVYEGSELQKFLSFDGEQYDLVEEVRQELGKLGMYHEECHTWHGAVYRVQAE